MKADTLPPNDEYMGQQDVYAFLQAKPNRWFTAREISDMLDVTCESVTMSLKRLREADEVEYRRLYKQGKTPYEYRFKMSDKVDDDFQIDWNQVESIENTISAFTEES